MAGFVFSESVFFWKKIKKALGSDSKRFSCCCLLVSKRRFCSFPASLLAELFTLGLPTFREWFPVRVSSVSGGTAHAFFGW